MKGRESLKRNEQTRNAERGAEAQLDAKLVAAMERLAHALHKALWDAAWQKELSATQAQVLLYSSSRWGRNATITQLAHRFDVRHATVSDAVRVLEEKGLIVRQPDRHDARAVRIRLTPRGRATARSLRRWTRHVEQQVAELPRESKSQFLATLLEIIGRLQRSGMISVVHTCTTCLYFERNRYTDPAAPHHCRLLDQPLRLVDLRIECPDYVKSPADAR